MQTIKFEVGEKVWLDNTEFIDDPSWVTLVGIPYIDMTTDMRKIL